MSPRTTINGKHVLLLLLYSPGKSASANEAIKGRTRLMKMMFLFREEILADFTKDSNLELTSYPDFTPWKYGPFAKDVYNDIEFFVNNGFVETERDDDDAVASEIEEYQAWMQDFTLSDEDDVWPTTESFRLTDTGVDFVAEHIYLPLTGNQKGILRNFKERLNEASLEAILRYTYLKYPESISKSTIKERVLGRD